MSTSSLLSSLLSSSSSSSNAVDLSSLLQVISGSSSSGIDVNAAVSAGVYAARGGERVWQAQQTMLQSQTTDLTSLSTAVSNLASDLNSLNDPLGTITSLALSSSQVSIVSGTATSGAVAGTHSVIVKNLAQTGSWYSDPVSTSFSTLPAGSFDIVAGGVTTTMSVGGGVNTLSDLVKNINTKNLGVSASVVTDSSGSRLSIVSNNSGKSNDFSISNISAGSGSSVPFFGFTQALQGKDASLTVDGIPITSKTNMVVGVLNGVTLNLASASPDTPVSVAIAPNTTQVGTAIQSFVTDYNSIVSGLNKQFTYNFVSQSSGDLAGDSAVRSLQSELLGAISYVSHSGGAFSTLGSMGISMGNDGTLTIDSGALSGALINDFSAVQSFFQGDALNGFAAQLTTRLNTFTAPVDGAFTVDLKSISDTNKSIQKQVDNFESNYIVSLQAKLQSTYSKAEIALQSLSAQQKMLDAELGNNSSSKG